MLIDNWQGDTFQPYLSSIILNKCLTEVLWLFPRVLASLKYFTSSASVGHKTEYLVQTCENPKLLQYNISSPVIFSGILFKNDFTGSIIVCER